MKTKLLFKRGAGGKIQQWCVEVDGPQYRTISGQVNGKQVTSQWTVAEPKNEGRANATSRVDQAIAEARAHYAKKLKSGYVESIEEATGSQRFNVMLAKEYKDYKDKLVLPRLAHGEIVWSQPKLDGIRCVATKDGLISRKGTPLLSCPHVSEALAPAFEAYPEAIIDGELYNHELHDDFDSLVKLIRKTTGLTEEDLALSREKIQFHVYDAAGTWGSVITGWNFHARYKQVSEVLIDLASPYLVPVRTDACYDANKIDFLYELYLEGGYEGQMVRLDEPYHVDARTSDLLKRKEFEDKEYTVVDIVEGKGNRAGVAGYAVLSLGADRTFSSGIKGGMDWYAELLANKAKYIGGEATVTFTNLTPKGVPRFPRIAKDKWWPGGRDL